MKAMLTLLLLFALALSGFGQENPDWHKPEKKKQRAKQALIHPGKLAQFDCSIHSSEAAEATAHCTYKRPQLAGCFPPVSLMGHGRNAARKQARKYAQSMYYFASTKKQSN